MPRSPLLAVVLCLFTVFTTVPARADFARGEAAFLKADFEAALVELTAVSGEGDGRADFLVGLMHLSGLGKLADPHAARRAFERATELGLSGVGVLGVLASGLSSLPPSLTAEEFKERVGRLSGLAIVRDPTFLNSPQEGLRTAVTLVPHLEVAAADGSGEARVMLLALRQMGLVEPPVAPMIALRELDLKKTGSPVWYLLAGAAFGLVDQTIMEPGGFDRAPHLALDIYRASAEGGYIPAQSRLMRGYATGTLRTMFGEHPKEIDAAAARHWFEVLLAAAERGDPEAQFRIAEAHFYHDGSPAWPVPDDESEGVRWYRAAAEGGHPEGMTGLASAYLRGEGIAKDLGLGGDWLVRAAEAGDKTAMLQILGSMTQAGSPELVHRYLVELAERGDSDMQVLLARNFERGSGTDADPTAAREWFKVAADQGDTEGEYNYGRMLRSGDGGEKDLERAIVVLQRAADKGHAGAQVLTAYAFGGGEGVAANVTQALRYARMAAMQGNGQGQSYLGAILWDKREAPRPNAYAWLLMGAANGGNTEVLEKLEETLSPAERTEAQALALRCTTSEYSDCP